MEEEVKNKEEKREKKSFKVHFTKWHDKNYKKLLLLPLAFFVLGIIYLIVFSSTHGTLVERDISLTGGTSVTILDGNIDKAEILSAISGSLEEVNLREIYDTFTGERKALIVETKSNTTITKNILEGFLGYTLNEKNSSFEFTGEALSRSFFKQLVIAVIIAFVFMSIVVFIIFRSFIPSMAVIISAFADIFMTLVLFNLLGMSLSSAGIVAFLMLIGYSVDTDILLTNRVLKSNEGSINYRLFKSFKTGITMTLTAIASFIVAILVVKSFSQVLTQIFAILLIGLFFDLINTWVTNVSILKWYAKKKRGSN